MAEGVAVCEVVDGDVRVVQRGVAAADGDAFRETPQIVANCRTHRPIKLLKRFRDPIDRQNKDCVKPRG
jgi:hypothetical protein